MEKIKIFGVEIDNLDFLEAMDKIYSLIEDRRSKVFTPNTEIVMRARDDAHLRELINSASLKVPDGIGLIYASKMRKLPLKERVTGFDISKELLRTGFERDLSFYFLGAAPSIAEEAAKNVSEDYGVRVLGTHDGYFSEDEERKIVDEINSLKPDVLFVGLGFPKQEEFISRYIDDMDVGMAIGNGGVLDILSGKSKRAPDIFIKLNLEWFYRLIKNPSRIKRQMAIPKFLISVLMDKNSVLKEC